MDFKLVSKGDWSNTFNFLERNANVNSMLPRLVMKGADGGVRELSRATPRDTGTAASRWSYEVDIGFGETNIFWTNDDVNRGYNIINLLQYGHGTGTGGYVAPRDFINPVMRRVYKAIADEVMREVVK